MPQLRWLRWLFDRLLRCLRNRATMQQAIQPDKPPPKTMRERCEGLRRYYLSTLPVEKPVVYVKLPETLPEGHPWAATWKQTGLPGKMCAPAPVVYVRAPSEKVSYRTSSATAQECKPAIACSALLYCTVGNQEPRLYDRTEALRRPPGCWQGLNVGSAWEHGLAWLESTGRA